MFVMTLKVPYYTLFQQYIIGLRYTQNMSLKCFAQNTKQIMHCSIPYTHLFQQCFKSADSVSVAFNANELLLDQEKKRENVFS